MQNNAWQRSAVARYKLKLAADIAVIATAILTAAALIALFLGVGK